MRFVFPLTGVLALSASALAGNLPFVFEPNVGQAAGEFEYIGRSPEGTVLLGRRGALLVPGPGGTPVRMTLNGARGGRPAALEKQHSYSNYLVGRDRSQWRTRVPHFARVRYNDVYPGIDVVYYTAGRHLEYDFIVAPGFSSKRIEIAFAGADRVMTDAHGDIVITAGTATIRQKKPRVYQPGGGEIEAAYHVTSGRVQLALGSYNPRRELVIDPVVQFSSYVGRTGYESATGIAVDGAGNTWVAGETNSLNFATNGAFQKDRSAGTDAWIARLAPTGELQWVTYFGGNQSDLALGVGTDGAGNGYLSGVTFSRDLPIRIGAQTEFGGGDFDVFAAKLNADGSDLVWSTYIGGSGEDWAANSMAVDAAGGAWIAGWTRSSNLPVRSALQSGSAGGRSDGFIARVDPAGRSFTYLTYLGSEGADAVTGVALDPKGNVYLTGSTTSVRFPSARAAQPRLAGGNDAFVLKLNPTVSEIVLSTYLGGAADDTGIAIAADPEGNAYLVGYTASADFPVTRGALQSRFAGNTDLFVARVSGVTGALQYATYLGGSGNDWPGGIAVDEAGSAYVSGWTNSADFPMSNPAQAGHQGGDGLATQRFDAVVARLAPGGDALLFSTFFGGSGEDRAFGIGLDRSGIVRIAGTTSSSNLPASSGASAGGDAFVAQISADTAVSLLIAQPSTLTLAARMGDVNPLQASVVLRASNAAVQWTASADVPWIRVTSPSGTTPSMVNVSLEPGTLPAGTHSGNIQLRTPRGTLAVPIVLTVATAPVIAAITPSTLPAGAAASPVILTGSGYTAASAVEIGGTRVVSTFVSGGTLRATVPAELLRSERVFDVVVVNPEVRSTPATLTITSGAPSVSTVVHAATWQAGGVAPGQIAIVGGVNFGPEALTQSAVSDGQLPILAGSVSVFFDDIPAPILWVSRGQAAILVPWTVSGRQATAVAVSSGNSRSAPVSVPVREASPGLFTSAGSGQGQAAAFNQDGTPNSAGAPAERGSVIVLYGTGEGIVSPLPAIGSVVAAEQLPRPVLPVSVEIGGVPAVLEYAGPVPGAATGLFQLNARVPSGIAAGEAIPVRVSAGPHISPPGVTVSVR